MPRQKSIVTIIRDLVRTEIQKAFASIFAGLGVGPVAKPSKAKAVNAKHGRRRKRRAGMAKKAPSKRRRPAGRKRKTAAPEG